MADIQWVPAVQSDTADFECWLRLFECLNVTLLSIGTPEAIRTFRALGPRRSANAHRGLLRERQRLNIEMESIGVCPIQGRLLFPAGTPGDHTTGADYETLAEAFTRCAPCAGRLGRPALQQWLLGRAGMHRQHSLLLEAWGMGRAGNHGK